MKKYVIIASLGTIGIIAAALSKIWAIISFILYLVKDRPFDWLSIIILPIGFLIWVIAKIYLELIKEKYEQKVNEAKRSQIKKSAFQKRLEEAQNKYSGNK